MHIYFMVIILLIMYYNNNIKNLSKALGSSHLTELKLWPGNYFDLLISSLINSYSHISIHYFIRSAFRCV